MDNSIFINQMSEIISAYQVLKNRAQFDDLSGRGISLDEVMALITSSKSAIQRVTGNTSEYYKDVDAVSKRTNLQEGSKLVLIIGSLMALKSDLENGYMKSLSSIIQSDVFSDYLEMAEHLSNEKYKDPAAVLAGSTLEVHLRELCFSAGIETEFSNTKGDIISKKADTMNAELAKAGIYSSLYQKQVTAWLGLRNAAAHGHYEKYTEPEVSLMLQGIRQFIISTKS